MLKWSCSWKSGGKIICKDHLKVPLGMFCIHPSCWKVVKEWFSSHGGTMPIKIKLLKKNYKDIIDRVWRGSAGEKEDLPSDFTYFTQIDAVMAGRPNVRPVNLLDSVSNEEENELGTGECKVLTPVKSPDQLEPLALLWANQKPPPSQPAGQKPPSRQQANAKLLDSRTLIQKPLAVKHALNPFTGVLSTPYPPPFQPGYQQLNSPIPLFSAGHLLSI